MRRWRVASGARCPDDRQGILQRGRSADDLGSARRASVAATGRGDRGAPEGRTRSPWDPRRTPGGCSGGAAAALADSSPGLPELSQIEKNFGWLLMAFLGANLPQRVYDAMRPQAGERSSSDRTPQSIRQRAFVASHREWMRAHRMRVALPHRWRQLFERWDVVICPVMPTVAFEHDDAKMGQRHIDIDGRSVPYLLQGLWAAPASLGGLPATAMPIGIQVVGAFRRARRARVRRLSGTARL